MVCSATVHKDSRPASTDQWRQFQHLDLSAANQEGKKALHLILGVMFAAYQVVAIVTVVYFVEVEGGTVAGGGGGYIYEMEVTWERSRT